MIEVVTEPSSSLEENVDVHSSQTEPFSVHSSHCIGCFFSTCRFLACPLSECSLCYASLHECKREDHREICGMEMIPCTNASFGCPLSLRRALIGRHLSVCAASVVSCSHERARAARDKPSKKELKSIGKKRAERDYDNPPSSANIPIDEAVALFDQRLIIDGYTYSRAERTRRRDKINVREPQLPLRPIVDGCLADGLNLSLPLPQQDVDVDSSEDERKIEEARIKKLRGLFADCYQCQVDPAMQHFHTLGRSDVRWDQLMYQRNRPSHYMIDPFYAEKRLMVSLHIEKVPEAARRSDTILASHRSRTLYTRRCLAVVPRRDASDHHESQHAKGGDMDLESLIVRCPLWWRGCSFYTARMKPKGGEIRFIQELGAFTYRPTLPFDPPLPTPDSSPLITAPQWVLIEIARFLSGVNLASLASTCKYLRETLFSSLSLSRGIVSLRWTKIDRCRWVSNLSWSFPLTELSPHFTSRPCSDLSSHIGSCTFNEPCPAPGFAESDETVPVIGAVTCLPSEIRDIIHEEIRKDRNLYKLLKKKNV